MKSISGGSKNPNFDPTTRTGWNQCHCENYRILVPTTIHGSKLELEQPRYHENRNDTLIDALQTFESHNFWCDCWIFEFHTFLETENQDLSKGVKIIPIREGLRPVAIERPPAALQWLLPRFSHPVRPRRGGQTFFLKFPFCLASLYVFSLFQTPKNTAKNTSKFLDSCISTKNIRYCFWPQFSFPWFYILDLGLCGCRFFIYHPHP